MATSKDYGLGEFTYPRGWFLIADASKVTSEPQPLHFFGRDLALYRGKQSGKVFLLDAICPHMGTNIACETQSWTALDGRVEGDCIRCPYHAWRFGPDGQCNDIPYSKKPIPPAAKLKSWTVVEQLGAVFVWHDPEDGEPEWEAPNLTEWDDPAYVHWHLSDLGELHSHPQEVVDNIADCSHLGPLHGSTVQFFENEFRGHLAIQRQGGGHRTLASKDGKSPLLVTDTVYHGPGILFSHVSGLMTTVMLIAHTPTEDGTIHVWFGELVKGPSGAAKATDSDVAAAREYQKNSQWSFSQDFGIWGHKNPCFHGMHVSGDGPFRKARLWYRQFYNPRAQREEILKRAEGVYHVDSMPPAPPIKDGESLAAAVVAAGL